MSCRQRARCVALCSETSSPLQSTRPTVLHGTSSRAAAASRMYSLHSSFSAARTHSLTGNRFGRCASQRDGASGPVLQGRRRRASSSNLPGTTAAVVWSPLRHRAAGISRIVYR
eukprot:3286819-Prymnesium_polylepis.1